MARTQQRRIVHMQTIPVLGVNYPPARHGWQISVGRRLLRLDITVQTSECRAPSRRWAGD